MNTISADEFKKRYGAQGLAQFNQTPQPKNTMGQVIGDAFKGGVEQVKQGFQQVNQPGGNPINLVEGIGKIGSGAINAVASPLAPVTNKIGQGINAITQPIQNNPTVQKFANSKAGQITSRVAEDVGNYANIAGTVGGAMEAPKIGGVVKTGVESGVGKVADVGLNAGKGAFETVAEKVHPTIDPTTQFLKDATPDFNKKLISEPGIKNPDGSITPRVQEGGLIKPRTITPKPLEQQAANELAKVKDYPINGTNLEKYQAVQPEIASRGEQLMTALQNEKILRPPQQIQKVISNAINKVPEESLLLQKSDPVISSYMRVAKNAIAKADGTLAGELKVRQLLDAAYKNARGKMAFGSDRISALDDIHTAARDALNQDIISKARNVDVKASLKSQWDLMRASDVLRNKAEAESGTQIGRFVQQNPITSKVLKGVGRAVGIGAGVDMFH